MVHDLMAKYKKVGKPFKHSDIVGEIFEKIIAEDVGSS